MIGEKRTPKYCFHYIREIDTHTHAHARTHARTHTCVWREEANSRISMYMYIVCILIDPFYTQPIKIALRTGAVGGGWGGGGGSGGGGI